MRLRVVGAVAAVLLTTALAVYGVSGLVRVRAMHREIEAAERELATLRLETERLTVIIDRLRNDPAYIEKLAREEHGLVRPGETVLKFPPKPK